MSRYSVVKNFDILRPAIEEILNGVIKNKLATKWNRQRCMSLSAILSRRINVLKVCKGHARAESNTTADVC